MSKVYVLLYLAIILVLLSSCNQFSQSIKDTYNIDETSNRTNKTYSYGRMNFLAKESHWSQAQEELMSLQEFKDRVPNFYSSIHFYSDGRINLQIQDPKTTEHVNRYFYRKGSWEDPEPVQMMADWKVKNSTYSLKDIKFENVASIFEQINDQSNQIEGAEEVTHIFLVHTSNKVYWNATIRGTRERYSVKADVDGKEIVLTRN